MMSVIRTSSIGDSRPSVWPWPHHISPAGLPLGRASFRLRSLILWEQDLPSLFESKSICMPERRHLSRQPRFPGTSSRDPKPLHSHNLAPVNAATFQATVTGPNLYIPQPIPPTPIPEAPVLPKGPSTPSPTPPPLAYEIVQDPLVRWSEASRNSAYSAPPTTVLLHGTLGSRKNWSSLARRLAGAFPAWQMLLVDLRCHGDSSTHFPGRQPPGGPHSVESAESAAQDVLQLIRHMKLMPQVLVGHSFGGKVALSMVHQAPKPLAKPVQVWVLKATPGEVHAGGDGEDHPAELIQALAAMSGPITDRKMVVNALQAQGFSPAVSQWMTTNLRAVVSLNPSSAGAVVEVRSLEWTFDLDGIAQMYASYEATNLWPMAETVPEGVKLEFLRAERSLHRWAHGDVQRIGAAKLRASAEGAGVRMHTLEDSGHWVHADYPDGLFRILAPSFSGSAF